MREVAGGGDRAGRIAGGDDVKLQDRPAGVVVVSRCIDLAAHVSPREPVGGGAGGKLGFELLGAGDAAFGGCERSGGTVALGHRSEPKVDLPLLGDGEAGGHVVQGFAGVWRGLMDHGPGADGWNAVVVSGGAANGRRISRSVCSLVMRCSSPSDDVGSGVADQTVQRRHVHAGEIRIGADEGSGG